MRFLCFVCVCGFFFFFLFFLVFFRQDITCINKDYYRHCKNIRRFYGNITGNQLPVHFLLCLQAPVNIFRNQAQNGSKGHY